MKSIKELAPKPSDALQAMLTGLKELPEKGKLKVDMDTFGRNRGSVCVGCAATACLMTLSGVDNPEFFVSLGNSNPSKLSRLRAYNLEDSEDSLAEFASFENAIDAFRNNGNLSWLGSFYGVNLSEFDYYVDGFIDSDNYWEFFPQIEQLIADLREEGL